MGNSCCPSSSYWGSYCIWSLFLSRVWVWRSRRQNFTQTFTLSAPLGNGPWCFSRDYISESLDWSAMSVYFLGWSKYFCHSFVIADDCLGSFLRNNTLSVSFGHESSPGLEYCWPTSTEAVTWERSTDLCYRILKIQNAIWEMKRDKVLKSKISWKIKMKH